MHAAVEHELLSLLQHHGIGTIVTEMTSSCNVTFATPTSQTHHCRGLTSVYDLYRHPHQHTSTATLIIHEDEHVSYDCKTQHDTSDGIDRIWQITLHDAYGSDKNIVVGGIPPANPGKKRWSYL
jgi:hypothetical protein